MQEANMSMIVDPQADDRELAKTAVEDLRDDAKNYRRIAAMMTLKSTADMLIGIAQDYDEEAARIEAEFVTSRTIQ